MRALLAGFDALAAGRLPVVAAVNGMLMQSEDFAEAMRAFMEKRAPVFKGR